MLFDLRSRGRRRTVQVIYLFLAIVMVAGLVLVGVGTGGSGGLLNAFTNNGSGNSSNNTAAIRDAVKQTREQPDSPQAWSNLVTVRWEAAQQGSNYDSATGAYTNSGKEQLALVLVAYSRYTALTNNPSIEATRVAAQANVILERWSEAAATWQTVASTQPSVNAFSCIALTSYAAKQSRLGGLASAKAIALTPKLERLELKQELEAAAKSHTSAAAYAAQSC